MANRRSEQQESKDSKAIAYIAAALVLGASAQTTATQLSALIGIPVSALLPALKIAMSKPLAATVSTLPSATAQSEAQRLEAAYRAQYVLSASRRIQGARSPEARKKVLEAEPRWYAQHLAAQANRRAAAQQVDRAAKRFGPVLGWYAKMDSITSEECRQANGKNFEVGRVPGIGFPGSVHPNCRCKAGRRHATSQTVYSIKTKSRAA